MPRLRLIALLCTTLCACGSIAPEPPKDEDGNEIVVPGAFDTYLGATALYGTQVGPNPTLAFQFDGFLDEDELLDFSVISLTSGGITVAGRVRWQMTTRTMEFRPLSRLVPGLRYQPTIDATRVVSVTGAPLGRTEFPKFLVVADEAEPAEELPIVRWDDVDAILEARCRGCHSDPTWQLNPLTHDSLVGRASAQSENLLVVPFDPGDSYLMHKVLPDFPIRRFTVQPPPWSDAIALTPAEVLLIEHWVATGARD